MKKSLSPLRPRTPHAIALAVVLSLLAGCADMSGITPQARMRDATVAGLPEGSAFEAPQDWWRGFGDAQLDALMDQALAGNPGLAQAAARVARAQAFADQAQAARARRTKSLERAVSAGTPLSAYTVAA